MKRFEQYIVVNGKRLRRGYTTGTCAAAAAKASAMMLKTRTVVCSVQLETPEGIELDLPVSDQVLEDTWAECSVTKDGGDDHDVTSGLKVFARVALAQSPQITLEAGEGIGTVTLPGLSAGVGMPAINPVPRKMILSAVRSVIGKEAGARVTLRVPGGDQAAARTMNSRLGVVGGISILGTTGIVNPMSEEAFRDSVILEVKVRAAQGEKSVVLVPGSQGRSLAVETLHIRPECIIMCSNFIGAALEHCAVCGIDRCLLVGHLGKLVKVAGGIFNTHSRVADARLEILMAHAALLGADRGTVTRLYQSTTTEACVDILREQGLSGVFDVLRAKINQHVSRYTDGRVSCETVLSAADADILSWDEQIKQFISQNGFLRGQAEWAK